MTEGVIALELDERGEDHAEIIPGVEEEEAGDGSEVNVGSGVSSALVLTLHQELDQEIH